MNKKLRTAILEAFEAPAPCRKEAFLQEHTLPAVSMPAFLRLQAVYIRKWVWAASFLIFGAALAVSASAVQDTVWFFSALTPLLALTIVTESGRSETYGMAELEMASRFSLKSIVSARILIIGLANLFLLCLLLLLHPCSAIPFPQTLFYLFCPYLLTAFSGLWICRKIWGKEAIYFCTGIAIFISFLCITLHSIFPAVYGSRSLLWWTVAFFLSGAGFLWEGSMKIRQTEELQWI